MLTLGRVALTSALIASCCGAAVAADGVILGASQPRPAAFDQCDHAARAPSGPAPERARLAGLYILLGGEGRFASPTLDAASAVGISVRAGWKFLQPAADRFDWSSVDHAMAVAAKRDKRVMLRVIAGIGTPAWALNGVEALDVTIDRPGHSLDGQTFAFPLPWDKVYLDRWCGFISELGKRYAGNPNLVLVHAAGPTFNTAEMHLPKDTATATKLRSLGYTRERIVGAWERVIPAYMAAFPKQFVALNLARPLADDGALEAILEHATRTYPDRLAIQGNWLSAMSGERDRNMKLVASYGTSVVIGFQMVGPTRESPARDDPRGGRRRGGPEGLTPLARGTGGLGEALNNGLAAGATYLEVYQQDFANPSLEADLTRAAGALAVRRR